MKQKQIKPGMMFRTKAHYSSDQSYVMSPEGDWQFVLNEVHPEDLLYPHKSTVRKFFNVLDTSDGTIDLWEFPYDDKTPDAQIEFL